MEIPSRVVIREPEFEEQLPRLSPDAESADDFTAGAEFALARDPQSGMPATVDRSIWTLPMALVGERRVSIFYAFDEKAVVLLSIVAFDD